MLTRNIWIFIVYQTEMVAWLTDLNSVLTWRTKIPKTWRGVHGGCVEPAFLPLMLGILILVPDVRLAVMHTLVVNLRLDELTACTTRDSVEPWSHYSGGICVVRYGTLD